MHRYLSRQEIAVTGSDAQGFLQNLITQDLAKADHALCYGALLTPQGKFVADFFIQKIENGYALDVDQEASATLLARLQLYKLRSDVNLQSKPLEVHCGHSTPMPKDAYLDPRHPNMGWRLYHQGSNDEGQDWDALRIENGIPAFAQELSSDSYILEMGFEQLNGVDFKKGCYVGQEVTARMHHKTTLQKGLVRLSCAAPVHEGANIKCNGKTAGTVHSAVVTTALAYVNLRRCESGKVTIDNPGEPQSEIEVLHLKKLF